MNVQSVHISPLRIKSLVSSNIIYKYSRGQCQSIYIGETKRHLISRICEHKGISFRTNRPLSNPSHSNIRQHAFNCDHPISTSNFSLLSKCAPNDLKLLESIYIQKIVPSLNNQNSSCPLNILNWIWLTFTMIFFSFYLKNNLFLGILMLYLIYLFCYILAISKIISMCAYN